MQGASPLASPRLSRRRHGLHLRCRCPLGCLPGWSPADLAVPESVGGACPLCRLPTLQPLSPPGGLPSLPPTAPAFSLAFCPHPPNPLPLRGRGRPRLFHARGSAPCIPAPEPGRHWNRGGEPLVRRGVPSESPTCRKTDRTAFLLAVPAAKERGDRGRGTSAFEMVLSPGAGRTSVAGVQPPRRARNMLPAPAPQNKSCCRSFF